MTRWRASVLALAAAACDALPRAPVAVEERAREPVAAPAATAQPASAATKPAPARPLPTLRRASGDVRVRLVRFDGASEIEIDAGGRAPVRLARAGDGVERGNAVESSIEVEPRDSRTPLEVGERCYPGSLRVRARGANGLEVTNLVELEDYVAGVVAAEVSVWSAEPEELRAQAIAARSYAVAALDERGRKSAEPYLFDDVRDQVYAGALAREHANVRAKVARAIESTRGLVLIEDDSVVDARFHAACGGATADARDVFPENVHACLRSVACEPCARASDAAWRFTASRPRLDALCARWSLGERLVRLRPIDTDAAGRWLTVEVAGDARTKQMAFEDFRRALGPGDLQSSRVVRTWPRPGDPIAQGMLFEGRGRGHGVGLCQRGALALARQGWSAERILAHYYPGAAIVDFR